MHAASVVGSQLAFSPSAARIDCARVTQPPAPIALKKFASEGVSPEGRKKLTSAAETQVGFTGLHGLLQPTARGPRLALESGPLGLACQFATKNCEFTTFAVLGGSR